MSDVIGVAIENWDSQKQISVRNWLNDIYGPSHYTTWYIDVQPMMVDLVMRKDIYFLFVAAFGKEYDLET